jgi:hypothetical protein
MKDVAQMEGKTEGTEEEFWKDGEASLLDDTLKMKKF